jgi:hypothetical protein
MTASMVRVTNLTPGSECSPTPRWRDAKLHLVFPVNGVKKSGVVTVEAKKRQGALFTTLFCTQNTD